MTDGDQPVRTLADGKYALTRVLGEGAMGVVYAGTHTALGRPVAVKLLHPGLLRHEIHGQRFQREARTASKLRHRNAVQILDFGKDGADYFIVMEFIQGRPLDDVLGDEVRLNIDRALTLTSQVCAALQAAHDQGIVHRDIKPGNVIISPAVDDDGRPTETVKVVDFGLAKIQTSPGDEGHQALTMEGDVCGTPEYMAPEQAQGLKLDHRADIYSTGVMLYDMLVGAVPFSSESALGTMYQQVHDAPGAPSLKNPRIPPELDAIVLRALAKRPEDRYQSAREFRGALLGLPQADEARDQVSDMDLERVMAPTMDYPDSPSSVTGRPRVSIGTGPAVTTEKDATQDKRRAWIPMAIAAAVLLAAGGGVFALLQGDADDKVAQIARQDGAGVTAVALPKAQPAALLDPPAPAVAAVNPSEADVPTPAPETAPVPEAAPVVAAVEPVGEPTPVVTAPVVVAPVPVVAPIPEAAPVVAAVVAPKPTRVRRKPTTRTRPVVKPEPAAVAAVVPTPAVIAKPVPEPVSEPVKEPTAVVAPIPTAPKPEPVVPKPEPVVAPPPKPTLEASARFGGLNVDGALTRSAVDRVVSKTRSDLQACYREAAVAAGRDAAAKLKVHWIIDVDGRARDVRVTGRAGLPGLSACVDRVFSRFRSRNRPDTGTVDASVVVTFTPRKP